ncbi:hypothetical protein O6H91_16G075700 [Diphasiastrum complanatum]|uniref:Uncharacterized protein n=1 Tax=Diphasiastrum complanatum TaxID=34168 RepID=A0ACC2BDM2_DIPCM|nr:hypothetical protein O6H91_16G075700 [Diphasiastrum complanatum]
MANVLESLLLQILLLLCLITDGSSISVMKEQPKEKHDIDGGFLEGEQSNFTHVIFENSSNASQLQAFPATEPYTKYASHIRRKLGLFQECSQCQCCTDLSKTSCFPTACCYSIDCTSPGLQFGHCLFTPLTCKCFGCS